MDFLAAVSRSAKFARVFVDSVNPVCLRRAFSSKIFSTAFVFLKFGSEGSKLNKWEVYRAWNLASATFTWAQNEKGWIKCDLKIREHYNYISTVVSSGFDKVEEFHFDF